MGEVVAALSEWVISKNMRPQKNVADDYIEMVQSNASRLESINSTIKKYNQALVYCNQDSKDLAIIQLKKVLSLNPKFVRAHQLLALLYIDSEQWEKAKRELVKCCNIDTNNTMTRRYMKIVDAVLEPDDGVRPDGKKRTEEAVRYQSDNEIIIQPLNVKEPKRSGLGTLFNVAIGVVIGLATMYFLVLPASIKTEKDKANDQVNQISQQLDIKTSTIAELEAERDDLERQITSLQNELEGYVGEGGTLKVFDGLMDAAKGYVETSDVLATANYLEEIEETIDISQTSAAFQELYSALFVKIGPEVSAYYYGIGYEAYRNELYEDAINNLTMAVKYDAANRDALFNLANAYKRSEDKDNALMYYQKVIELFPGTQSANRSQRYIDELNAE